MKLRAYCARRNRGAQGQRIVHEAVCSQDQRIVYEAVCSQGQRPREPQLRGSGSGWPGS